MAALHGDVGLLLKGLGLRNAAIGLWREVERSIRLLICQIELRNLDRGLTFGLEGLVHNIGLVALKMPKRLIVLFPVGLSLRFDGRGKR